MSTPSQDSGGLAGGPGPYQTPETVVCLSFISSLCFQDHTAGTMISWPKAAWAEKDLDLALSSCLPAGLAANVCSGQT